MSASLLIILTLSAAPDTVLVTPAWLSAHLGQPGIVVIHADRDRTAYNAGHIAGSAYLALSAFIVERDGIASELPAVTTLDSALETVGIGDGTRVIITGDPLAAARLFFTLDFLGHGAQAALLDGGTPAWVAAGYPVGAEVVPARRGALTPRVRPEVLADAAWVRAHLGDSTVALLDARPPADYAGTPGSATPSGHIPGARNIFWKTTMGGAPPVLLDGTALAAMFRTVGAAPGDVVVTYCRTGMQASFLYFVARFLGYEVRMYDGSFAEWSQLAGMPIEQGAGE